MKRFCPLILSLALLTVHAEDCSHFAPDYGIRE